MEGLPPGCMPIEDSAAVEIFECLFTHMDNPDLPTV